MLCLIAGEAFGLLTTAERCVTSREAQQQPFHDAQHQHDDAKARFAAAEASDALARAEAGAATVSSEAMAKSAEKGCREYCRQVLEAGVRNAQAAVAETRTDIQREISADRFGQ